MSMVPTWISTNGPARRNNAATSARVGMCSRVTSAMTATRRRGVRSLPQRQREFPLRHGRECRSATTQRTASRNDCNRLSRSSAASRRSGCSLRSARWARAGRLVARDHVPVQMGHATERPTLTIGPYTATIVRTTRRRSRHTPPTGAPGRSRRVAWRIEHQHAVTAVSPIVRQIPAHAERGHVVPVRRVLLRAAHRMRIPAPRRACPNRWPSLLCLEATPGDATQTPLVVAAARRPGVQYAVAESHPGEYDATHRHRRRTLFCALALRRRRHAR
jgi:hypothetical protein